MNKCLVSLAGIALISGLAAPAQAISLTLGGQSVAGEGQVSSVSGVQTITFNNGTVPTTGFATYSLPAPVLDGFGNTLAFASIEPTSIDVAYSLTNDTSPFLTISRRTSDPAVLLPPVSINFAGDIDYFGMYWGWIDAYNVVTFYQNGNQVAQVSGQQLLGQTISGQTVQYGESYYANFFADPGQTFDQVTLQLNPAYGGFESDNHAYRSVAASVPEASTSSGILLLGALGLALRARKRF